MSVVAIPTGIITAGFMEAAASETHDTEETGMPRLTQRRVLDITGPGTVVQAPAKYYRDGDTIEQLALERFAGRCVVTTLSGLVTPEQMGTVIASSSAQAVRRILLRGNCELSKETAAYLNEMRVLLVGSQSGSIGDAEVCYELLGSRAAILLNLDLVAVEDGEYFLSAAPLLMENADTSPCRAYLMR